MSVSFNNFLVMILNPCLNKGAAVVERFHVLPFLKAEDPASIPGTDSHISLIVASYISYSASSIAWERNMLVPFIGARKRTKVSVEEFHVSLYPNLSLLSVLYKR